MNTDPLTEATLTTLTAMVQDWVDTDRWDAPPVVYTITRELMDDGMLAQATIPIPLPEAVWEAYHPLRVLRMLVDVVRGYPDPLEREHVGVVFLVETWALSLPDTATPEQIAAANAWAGEHSIADHPDGKETKSAFAVDTAGYWYTVIWPRGQDAPSERTAIMPTAEHRLSGAIPAELADLLNALNARSGRAEDTWPG